MSLAYFILSKSHLLALLEMLRVVGLSFRDGQCPNIYKLIASTKTDLKIVSLCAHGTVGIM